MIVVKSLERNVECASITTKSVLYVLTGPLVTKTSKVIWSILI
jgi:hypothetical protein